MKKIAKRFALVLAITALLFSFVLGNTAVSRADSLVQLSEANIKLIEQCEAVIDGSQLVVTDTDDNNDVWSSKLLVDAGVELTPGEQYTISFSLTGENGVGEFFLCKGENIDERYDETFAAEDGTRSISFKAAQSRVYIGMQVGNLGKGKRVTAAITNLSKLSESENPALLRAENCAVDAKGSVITATDMHDNNDVWNSKLLYNTGMALEIGKTYTLNFSLSGSHGVGEFFVCKSPDINNRDDGTFVNQAGSNSVTFTAAASKLYIGMQFGNLGPNNSVKLSITELKEKKKETVTVRYNPGDEPQQGTPRVLLSENCTYQVDSAENQTVINAVDTSDNNDVCCSKLLLFLGEILEENKFYAANINLAGKDKVGEFFFCKEDNLDNRYSFDNTPGDHTAKFKAEDSKLYAGMQFGDIGEGNDVTATINGIYRIPGMQTSSENCAESLGQDTITLTDTDDNGDIWNSKAVFDSGIALEAGKAYTATFTLTGDNGVGEFYFLKSADIDQRYTFDDQPGTHTVNFTAEGTALYFGIQCGNIGNGNSVSVSNITVAPFEEEEPAPSEETESTDESDLLTEANDEADQPEAPAPENQPAESEAPAEEPAAASEPETATDEAVEDEDEEEDEDEDAAEPAGETEPTEAPASENQPAASDEPSQESATDPAVENEDE